MAREKNRISYSAATHIGARETNQDALTIDFKQRFKKGINFAAKKGRFRNNKVRFFAVFDGMGGTKNGIEASSQAATMLGTALKKYLKEYKNIDKEMRPRKQDEDSLPPPEQLATPDYSETELIIMAMRDAIDEIDAYIYESDIEGGTTAVVLAVLPGGEFILYNIGDSPAFLVSGGQTTELSLRHNEAQRRKENDPNFDENSRGWDYLSSRLYACVGMSPYVPSEIANIKFGNLKKGDQILLCTDGVSGPLAKENLERILQYPAEEIVKYSVNQSKAVADNATAIVVDYN